MVAAGSGGVEARRLQGGADHRHRVLELLVRHAADRGAAGRGVDQPQDHAQRGCLAGTVRAEKACDGPGLDGEAELIDRTNPAVEYLGEPVDDDAPVRTLWR